LVEQCVFVVRSTMPARGDTQPFQGPRAGRTALSPSGTNTASASVIRTRTGCAEAGASGAGSSPYPPRYDTLIGLLTLMGSVERQTRGANGEARYWRKASQCRLEYCRRARRVAAKRLSSAERARSHAARRGDWSAQREAGPCSEVDSIRTKPPATCYPTIPSYVGRGRIGDDRGSYWAGSA